MPKKSGISIEKSRKTKQLYVLAKGRNGEKLHHSETVKQLQSAFKNIVAAGREYVAVLNGEHPVTVGKEQYHFINGKWEKLIVRKARKEKKK